MWVGLVLARYGPAAYTAAAWLLAAATTLDPLLAFGPLGVFAVALSLGYLVPKPIYDRAIADRDRAEGQSDTFRRDVMERVVPVVQRAIEMTERRGELDDEMIRLMADVRRALERH